MPVKLLCLPFIHRENKSQSWEGLWQSPGLSPPPTAILLRTRMIERGSDGSLIQNQNLASLLTEFLMRAVEMTLSIGVIQRDFLSFKFLPLTKVTIIQFYLGTYSSLRLQLKWQQVVLQINALLDFPDQSGVVEEQRLWSPTPA